MNQIAQVNFNQLQTSFGSNALSASPTIGDVVGKLLLYIYAIGGMALLVYLVIGGFKLMTSSGDPKAIDEAKKAITHALIGFVVLFVAYWIIELAGLVLGIPSIVSIF